MIYDVEYVTSPGLLFATNNIVGIRLTDIGSGEKYCSEAQYTGDVNTVVGEMVCILADKTYGWHNPTIEEILDNAT